MKLMNSTKKYNGSIYSRKNKLNSKINWFFKLEPNAQLHIAIFKRLVGFLMFLKFPDFIRRNQSSLNNENLNNIFNPWKVTIKCYYY